MEKQELTLKDLIIETRIIWKYLLSKWIIILLFVIIGSSLGVCVSLYTDSKYVGTLKFVIEEDKKAGGGLSSIASSFGLGGLGGETSLFSSPNIIEFLKTRSMIEETLLKPVGEKNYEKMTYADLYIKKNKLRSKWKDKPTLKNLHYKIVEDRSKFTRTKDSVLGVIYSNLLQNELIVTQPNEDNSVIEITVTSKSEVFSKNFPSELIGLAAAYYSDSKTKKARNSVDILQKQVDSVKNELYASMGSAASANDKVFGLNPAMNVKRVPSAKQQVKVQVNSILLQELIKNLEISKMNLLNDTPIINVIDKPVYPLFEDKLRKLKGILIGGILSGVLITFILIIRRYLKKLNLKNIDYK